MNKLALIVASLICFAGCARNDTDSPTADYSSDRTNYTAVGSPASSQSGSDLGSTAPMPGAMATNDSSLRSAGSLMDTNLNSLSDTNTNSLNNVTQPLPPGAGRPSEIQNGSNTQPPSNSQADQGGLSPTGNNNNSQTPQ